MIDARDPRAAPETGRLSLSRVPGWSADDHRAALSALALSQSVPDLSEARAYFEDRFRLAEPVPCHLTGYYEPEIPGSLHRCDSFPVPLHGIPVGGCTLTRAEIEAQPSIQSLAWVSDEVERFFLQVQGSGRLRLAEGGTLRVGYGGKTGHPYRSIGQLLRDRGHIAATATADDVKAWLRQDPERGRAVMRENPSYVFFRTLDIDQDKGPLGTLGCPVTAGRTLAVDPEFIPLGTPVWIDVAGYKRLCIAQDTGSAIKGSGRADLFLGTGASAGQLAGALNHHGQMIPLVPR